VSAKTASNATWIAVGMQKLFRQWMARSTSHADPD
jgi:hypothetical protein